MPRDLGTLLRETAPRPDRTPDPTGLVARGRRRRGFRRAAVGAGAAVAVVAAALVVSGPGSSPAPPEIVDQPTGIASPSDAPGTIAPSPGASRADEEAARVRELEIRRDALRARIDEQLLVLAELRGRESELRFRQEQGEDVEDELAALAVELAERRSEVGRLSAELFAVEQQLVEVGALDDPVATARAAATDEDRALTSALVELARDPSPSTVDAVPFSPTVQLGLADELLRDAARDELDDPGSWVLDPEVFRAFTGPFSPLELLAQDRPTQTLVGPHPHCASPPVPAPPGFEDHRRVSVQPIDGTSCLEWWTVDLFVRADGTLEAVTMDLYEP